MPDADTVDPLEVNATLVPVSSADAMVGATVATMPLKATAKADVRAASRLDFLRTCIFAPLSL
ncbi:hypothetical protein GCM10025789_26600 [Tessaracoccus lubricantis]|uniref:Uncharacterized protein n=1 Tax=Tessaracoccus lubricantis TaxID=545543 RepID=A0ABP9FK38_9ACTN